MIPSCPPPDVTTPPAPQAGAHHPTPDVVKREAATRVLRQFRQVFNAVKTHFQQVERQAGVGGAQVWALSVVRERPGIGMNDLARALDVRQPTASNLVQVTRRSGPGRGAPGRA